MRIEAHVDWLTLTTPVSNFFDDFAGAGLDADYDNMKNLAYNIGEILTGFTVDLVLTPAPTARFMATWKCVLTGISVSFPFHESGVIMVVMPGTTFETVQFNKRMVDRMTIDGWRVRRVDYAIDVYDSGISVSQHSVENAPRRLEGDNRKFSFTSSRTGDTFTLGSRASDRYLRVYDKAAQLGMRHDQIRVELECKGDVAELWQKSGCTDQFFVVALLKMLRQSGSNLVSQVEMLHDEGIQNPNVSPGRKQTSTENWFAHQVAPALARIKRDDPYMYEHIKDMLISVMK